MKGLFLITIGILAWVGGFTTNAEVVDGSCGDSNHWVPTASCQSTKKLSSVKEDWEHRLCNFFVCLTKLATSGGSFDMSEIMKCINTAIPRGENNAVQFHVHNGAGAKNNGFISNAVLTWGKWQVNGVDVVSVNGMKFSNTNTAIFKAMGRENSPSGTEGSFDIIENDSELAATVTFSVPWSGQDKINVKNAGGSNYVCAPSETRGLVGPLSYDILCHKINNS
ncbi:hypothetical protein [Trichoplusia ni ascovirus 2c]|uniref:hypothetical protein n=1 Tax=Trichoplusia ni ascovirus 2c TaxID=328615 RepID=UPI0000E441F5|nr:hypothetical protein TNAV2c_gp029 [Trichoplusia ni ascovirus 2c]ABF70546.1 hypothetical protein [Trichoplusia ni ascovirus 2c]